MITTRDPDVIRAILQRGGALVLAMPERLAVTEAEHAWAVAQVAARRERVARREEPKP